MTAMTTQYYLWAVLFILIGGYCVNFIVEYLDISQASLALPGEFEGYYDVEKYAMSQSYLKKKIWFNLIESTLFTAGVIVFILAGWFNLIDGFALSFHWPSIGTGLIFWGTLYFVYFFFSIPFTAYKTFIIEERYGFNKTTLKTFVTDHVMGMVLTLLIGAVLASVVLWIFNVAGTWAWCLSWGAVTVFELFLLFIAPVAIMPLFNKFTPLKEGELKEAINAYAKAQHFKIQGIYTMDASRRSAKSNAFFTGFGANKRIVLFDTLVTQMTTNELVAVLAHEIGHYKHKDVMKSLAIVVISTGLMFFALSCFINNKDFFEAFGMEQISVYAGLFLSLFLYLPVNDLISVVTNYVTRRFEFSADRFSVETYQHPEAMISALKRLSVENLTNLTPHPLKVFLSYSHPPVLARIKSIRQQALKLEAEACS